MLMRTDRIQFLDLTFDCLTFEQVRGRLQAVSAATPYLYVVTPNVDHIVRIHREPQLRDLYEGADICVCDSRILRLLARLSGIRLPLVPGSDLVRALFVEVISPGDRIAVIGSTSELVRRLRAEFPAVEFVHHQPPMGLRSNPEARTAAAAFLADANARFAFVTVGSPQQEMIASEARRCAGAAGLALCVGAGLEFLTGEQKRAPRIVQRLALEWAHRLATNPRRLWRRYLVDGVRIFPIWIRWRASSGRRTLTVGILIVAVLLATAGTYAGYSFNRRTQSRSSIDAALPPPSAQNAAIRSLPPPDLLRPLSPEEAVKENTDRPFVNRPDTAASRFVLRADAADRERALTCLAQAVYYEAASEGVDGGRAVAQVVVNRLRHPGYPASVCGVVYEGSDRPTGCQFTFTCDGSLLRTPEASLWARSRKIAEEALSGHVFAPVGHATSYHADYVLPYWADSLDKMVQIGRHIFYRLRGTYGNGGSFFQRYAGIEPQLPDPRAAVVLPASADTAQLASALISDSLNGPAKDVEKAVAPASPLAIDSAHGTLLADAGAQPPAVHKAKPANECSAGSERKQLAPLGATDMRASGAGEGC
jgi:exopolysaccharide biosynthesis WecB/TagA/CpsF family protein